MLQFSPEALRASLVLAIRAAFAEFKIQRANETLYGFSLSLEALGNFVAAYGASEEGLAREVARYQHKKFYQARQGDLAQHLTCDLRWNCENGWLALDGPFVSLNESLRASYDQDPEQFYESGHTRLVYTLCLAALAECDADGLFGRGAVRDSLTLNLSTNDDSDEQLLRWAAQVNPPHVSERYRAELALGRAASAELIYNPPKRLR